MAAPSPTPACATASALPELPIALHRIADMNQKMFRWGKLATLGIVGGAIGTIASLHMSRQTMLATFSPTTTLYLKMEKPGDGEERSPADPKLEVKFGNIGNTPMYVERFEIRAEQPGINSIESAVAEYEKSHKEPILFVVSNDSTSTLAERWQKNHPLANNPHLLVLCTVRPKSGCESEKWDEQFRKVAADSQLRVCTTFTNGPDKRWYEKVQRTEERFISP